jgi:Domain of unknown function (DUF4367)
MNTPITPLPDERLREVARRLSYPSTPDISKVVTNRLASGSRPWVRMGSAWVVASLLILVLAVLFAVPNVRAEIIRFLQVGVVRIFPADATQTAIPASPPIPLTATLVPLPQSTRIPRPTITPYTSQPEPLYSITASGLAVESSLEHAQSELPFPIRLPEYPPDLGAPDRVFLQENDQMAILVWTEPDDPDKARFSLHEIGPGSVIIGKFEPRVIQEIQVNGNYAVWVKGPYLVQLTNDTYNWRRLVEGNTLIWEEEEITYRLETDLSLDEAVKIAESLK